MPCTKSQSIIALWCFLVLKIWNWLFCLALYLVLQTFCFFFYAWKLWMLNMNWMLVNPPSFSSSNPRLVRKLRMLSLQEISKPHCKSSRKYNSLPLSANQLIPLLPLLLYQQGQSFFCIIVKISLLYSSKSPLWLQFHSNP